MQHRTDAAEGAWTLASPWHAHVRDALSSIELVDMDTTAAPTMPDPIAAARTWLADPARRSRLSPDVVRRADASVALAEVHVRRIDAICAELAEQLLTPESTNTERMREVDDLLDVLGRYSTRLREVLDPERPAPDVERRLDAALDAARVGGLQAFVESLD